MKNLLIALVIAVLAAACSNTFYGTSNYPEPKELPKNFASKFDTEIVWQKKINMGSEVKALYFVPDTDGKNVYAVGAEGYFYSFDADSGKENYRVKLKNKISSGVTVAGNLAFIGSQNGDLMALNTEDGKVAWRTPLGSMLLSPARVDDGILAVFTSGGEVLALNPENGEILWRYLSEMPILSMQGTSSPIIGGGVVIITDDSGAFIVLDIKTGLPAANQKLARKSANHLIGKIIDQNANAKINKAGILFASSYQNRTYAVNLEKGGLLWENESVTTNKDFEIDQQNIYLISGYDEIVALNQTNGTEVWRNKNLYGRRLSPLIAIPNYLGTIDLDGNLIWLSLDTGEIVAIKRIAKTSAISPALTMPPDKIIWQLSDGRLIAFKLKQE